MPFPYAFPGHTRSHIQTVAKTLHTFLLIGVIARGHGKYQYFRILLLADDPALITARVQETLCWTPSLAAHDYPYLYIHTAHDGQTNSHPKSEWDLYILRRMDIHSETYMLSHISHTHKHRSTTKHIDVAPAPLHSTYSIYKRFIYEPRVGACHYLLVSRALLCHVLIGVFDSIKMRAHSSMSRGVCAPRNAEVK